MCVPVAKSYLRAECLNILVGGLQCLFLFCLLAVFPAGAESSRRASGLSQQDQGLPVVICRVEGKPGDSRIESVGQTSGDVFISYPIFVSSI